MSYDPAALDLRTVFRRALDVVGAGRILFGTDSSFFPRGWQADIFEQQTKVLYELALDEAEVRNILHDNLVSLFGEKTYILTSTHPDARLYCPLACFSV